MNKHFRSIVPLGAAAFITGASIVKYNETSCKQVHKNTIAPQSTVIIGGGVVGLTSAYYLSKRGVKVTIIERNKGPGLGASLGNAGALRRNITNPVIDRTTIPKFISALINGDEHIVFDPKVLGSYEFLRWGTNFVLGCASNTLDDLRIGVSSLVGLSHDSLDDILNEESISHSAIDLCTNGSLQLFRTHEQFENGVKKIVPQDGVQILEDAQSVIRVENSLKNQENAISGGVLYLNDRSASCPKFASILAQKLVDLYNVEIIYGEDVTTINMNKDGTLVQGVETTSGKTIETDSLLVCCGYESSTISKKIGEYLPVYPLRGYSLTYKAGINPPSRVIMDPAHVFMTPFGDMVRFTGVGEFTTINNKANKKCIAELPAKALELFPEAADHTSENNLWVGHRPQTPDDLPIIAQSKVVENVFYNTGHGSRGWVMAAGSANIISCIMCGDSKSTSDAMARVPLERYDHARFWC